MALRNTKNVNKEVADVFHFTCRAGRLRDTISKMGPFAFCKLCRKHCRLQVLPSCCFLNLPSVKKKKKIFSGYYGSRTSLCLAIAVACADRGPAALTQAAVANPFHCDANGGTFRVNILSLLPIHALRMRGCDPCTVCSGKSWLG